MSSEERQLRRLADERPQHYANVVAERIEDLDVA